MERRFSQITNGIVNALVLVAFGVFLFRPGGVIPTAVANHRESRRQQARIAALWDTLANTATRLDSTDAAVTIVEFADYRCSYCRQFHEELARAGAHGSRIRLVFRYLPLGANPAAVGAARAAICAERQGRFREMHDRLFSTNGWQETQDWIGEAQAVGISDTATFGECLLNDFATRRLEEDRALVDTLGIRVTPTFVWKGGLHAGVLPLEELLSMAQ